MNSTPRSFFYFLFTGSYAIFLLTFLLLPSDSLPEHKILSADKLWHMLSYFLLALGLMFSFREGGWKRWYNRRWSLIISLGHAGFSEVLQEFVPGRSASIDDWIANCIGIGLALLGLNLFPKFFEKSSSP
ncbi:MAG: VanZ family protein [Candidatus Marinimicrobia bacterium]|nr:VanZ family protein [Candidatus Neomarinimicrobiota bacterium]